MVDEWEIGDLTGFSDPGYLLPVEIPTGPAAG